MGVNYTMMAFESLLIRDIKRVEMSVELEHMCAMNKFYTFGDLLMRDTNQLLSKPGFHYRMQVELFGLLKSMDQHHLLKD